jgi:hypothetical protein
MEPKEAAATLTQAIKDTKDQRALLALAQGLSAVTARMEPKEAAAAVAPVAATLTQAIKDTKDPNLLSVLARGLSAVAARMEPKGAADAIAQGAAGFFRVMADRTDPSSLRTYAPELAALLSTGPPPEISRRAASVTGAGTDHPITALPLLLAAAEPLPCRLSTQRLVELLKYPSCVGEARRVVLDSLGHRYQRRFADLWQFVDYAQKHLPDIDLTSPPKRPHH